MLKVSTTMPGEALVAFAAVAMAESHPVPARNATSARKGTVPVPGLVTITRRSKDAEPRTADSRIAEGSGTRRPGPGSITFSVTGTLMLRGGLLEETATLPRNVPAARPLVFTEISTVAGASAVKGRTLSHPVDSGAMRMGIRVLVGLKTPMDCAGGFASPRRTVKVNALGETRKVGGPPMVRLSAREAVCGGVELSVTWAVKLAVVWPVGVPEIWPVAARLSPAGRLPPISAQR